jgi:5-formaminoimidazole-4-carboxamide-1-beta-D-ribofuranosyl 5'-monophosphate synthetase
MTQSGFPDFVCIKFNEDASDDCNVVVWEVQFVECKCNGTLSKIEKEKVEWIKDKLHIPVFVASKEKEDRTVVVKYEEMKGGKTINGNKK